MCLINKLVLSKSFADSIKEIQKNTLNYSCSINGCLLPKMANIEKNLGQLACGG